MPLQSSLLMFFALLLSFYFAAMFGVAGLAKVEHPSGFVKALHQQGFLPKWSVSLVGYTFPWGEILLAVALALGFAPFFTAIFVVLLSLIFFGIHMVLYRKTEEADCGCFGAGPMKIDLASVITSGIFMCLAIAFLSITIWVAVIPGTWRIVPGVLFLSTGCWLGWRIALRHRVTAKMLTVPTAVSAMHTQALNIGERAPLFTLPDLYGRILDFGDFHGQQVAVLFWNPHCGYCTRMLNELKHWESNRPVDAPQLLVVSQGMVEDNKKDGFQSPVVLDNDFTIRRGFGASGTPMSVMIDAHGIVTSEMVIGSQGVFRLLNPIDLSVTKIRGKSRGR